MIDDIIEIESPKALAVQPVQQVTAGPLAMALQALNSGMTIEQMRGMLDLQKDWEANEARKAYVADMAEFKKNPPEIFKRKQVGFKGRDGAADTSYMHATIGDVTSLTVAALAPHGFSHRWNSEQREGGQIFVTCILTHRLGHTESTTLNSSADQSGKKNNIQALASTITYLQRYTLLAACGLATKDMEDDDGAAGETSGEPIYNGEETVAFWIGQIKAAINFDDIAEQERLAGIELKKFHDLAGWHVVKAAAEQAVAALQSGAKR